MEWEERGRNKRSKVEKVGGKIAGKGVKGRVGWAQDRCRRNRWGAGRNCGCESERCTRGGIGLGIGTGGDEVEKGFTADRHKRMTGR